MSNDSERPTSLDGSLLGPHRSYPGGSIDAAPDPGPLPGPDGDAEPVPGARAVPAGFAGAAAWIDMGSLHRLHHSDSMIPILVSLQAWTPFYWGQDRLGMLVPLLVWPVRSPFGNLLAQGFVNVFCVLAAFVLLARYVRRDASYPVLGAVGAAAFLVLAPPFYRFDLMMNHNFGIWLALGLAGLIAAESRAGRVTGPRLLVALVLILLAHWVYLAAGYYLVVLVGFRALGVLAAPGAVGRTDAPGGPALLGRSRRRRRSRSSASRPFAPGACSAWDCGLAGSSARCTRSNSPPSTGFRGHPGLRPGGCWPSPPGSTSPRRRGRGS